MKETLGTILFLLAAYGVGTTLYQLGRLLKIFVNKKKRKKQVQKDQIFTMAGKITKIELTLSGIEREWMHYREAYAETHRRVDEILSRLTPPNAWLWEQGRPFQKTSTGMDEAFKELTGPETFQDVLDAINYAQAAKENPSNKIPKECPECGETLFCDACGAHHPGVDIND